MRTNVIFRLCVQVGITALLSAALLPVNIAAAADPAVKVVLGGTGATSWAIGPIAPGASGVKAVTVQNSGTGPGELRIWLSDITGTEGTPAKFETPTPGDQGELDQYLTLAVLGSGLTSNVFMPCLVAGFPQSAGENRFVSLSRLNAGQTVNLTWAWSLPTSVGNIVQGDGLSFSINYTLTEIIPPTTTTTPPPTTSRPLPPTYIPPTTTSPAPTTTTLPPPATTVSPTTTVPTTTATTALPPPTTTTPLTTSPVPTSILPTMTTTPPTTPTQTTRPPPTTTAAQVGFKVDVEGNTTAGPVDPEKLTTSQDLTAASPNTAVKVVVQAGTIALQEDGSRLETLTVDPVPKRDLPPIPAGMAALSEVIDIGPEGAYFSQPITITLRYDPAKLAPGTDESSLYLAHWNGSAWIALPSTVDTVNHVISIQLTRILSTYAILGKAAPAPPSRNWLWPVVITPEVVLGILIFIATRGPRLVLCYVPQSIRAGEVSSPITVELRHAFGWRQRANQDTTVNISSSNPLGRFDLKADGSFQDVKTVIIPKGQSEASFYYRDGSIGASVITASDGSGHRHPSHKGVKITSGINPFSQIEYD